MKEYILCAAIWYKEVEPIRDIPQLRPKNIDKGIVILGHRHGQCIWTLVYLRGLRSCTNGCDCAGDNEQGFLTNTNRFVDRKETLKIAILAGQIEKANYDNQLYSEDLY